MGLRINTNIQALNAHKNLTKTDSTLGASLERLSSGLRINKAADDASGLAIADTLRAQHTGIGQAIANANDGVNIIQIADGALEESLNIVNTIRTKAIQSASDGQSATSRKAIQADVNKLLEELEMIGNTTAYNGVSLLDGGFINKSFHVGAYKDQVVGVSIGDARGTKIGAMAYAETNKEAEAAVSNPFVRGSQVTSEALSSGDIKINGIQIGSAISQRAAVFSTNSVAVRSTTFGSNGTAFAKAVAINEKTNLTGVAAKATTELVVRIDDALTATSINDISLSAASTAAMAASVINNNSYAKAQGIRAELVTGSQVRIIADDGRNLVMSTGAAAGAVVNGASMAGLVYTQRGTLTLTNARAMANSEGYIKDGSLNTGELLINGVDIAAGGALTILDGDKDRTLVNAINNNKDLQALGIRAELYISKGDSAGNSRIRLISENTSLEIGGSDPNKIAQLVAGTTQGIKTTGIVVEGSATDSDPTKDNYLRTLGFDGAQFGTKELDGASNSGGNDVAVVSKSYLKSSQVTAEALSAGDLIINGIQIGSAISQRAAVFSTNSVAVRSTTFGSNGTAFAKAVAINEKTNLTGVAAKATTELVVRIDDALTATSINDISLSAASTAAMAASVINNNSYAKAQGIRAELVTGSQVRIIADDGRNLVMSTGAAAGAVVNGASMAGLVYTQRGTLTLTNARAMTNGEGYIQEDTLNQGELVINGVDIAKGGSLTILQGDKDRTLVNAINNNADLQKMGIRAELYLAKGDTAGNSRIRLISERDAITVSGTDPNKVARMTSGTTEGNMSTEINLGGALVDSDLTSDNYLRAVGFDGAQFGTAEATGVDNTGGNDRLVFGKDRLNYNFGDVQINGYKVGETVDDGISHALGDKSAAALAAAVNLVKTATGVEADIIKAVQEGAGTVAAGTLQQRDLVINGVDIVRDNTGGNGMAILDGDADHTLMNAINEYKDQTGVIASINDTGKLVLSAVDGRNIHVQSTANGNKLGKFEADFGEGKGVAQDSVYMGNIRLVADASFKVDGAGASNAAKEISLLKMGLAGGGASTKATSDLKGDGTFIAGVNYDSAIAKVDVTTQEGAEMAIRSADYAIKRLDELRSGLGSTQNQLTSTIANLSVTKINVQATESTIRDVDFAAESTTFSKMQVLMQAGTYAQSQANAMSQNVMRLLQ